MSAIDLDAVVAKILEHGPTRVLTSDIWAEAPANGCRGLAVIFVRNDGWSLGAPDRLVDAARALWAEAWVVELRLESGQWVRRDLVRAA